MLLYAVIGVTFFLLISIIIGLVVFYFHSQNKEMDLQIEQTNKLNQQNQLINLDSTIESQKKNEEIMKKHSSLIGKIQTTLRKNTCFSTSKDKTSCFTVSRKAGVNEVNTKFIQIEVKPIYKDIITKTKYKVTYKCRFVPQDLDERGVILFDGAMARPELMTLNREMGTLDIMFHTTLNTLKFKMYPYIHTLSIMKILVEDLSEVSEEQ